MKIEFDHGRCARIESLCVIVLISLLSLTDCYQNLAQQRILPLSWEDGHGTIPSYNYPFDIPSYITREDIQIELAEGIYGKLEARKVGLEEGLYLSQYGPICENGSYDLGEYDQLFYQQTSAHRSTPGFLLDYTIYDPFEENVTQTFSSGDDCSEVETWRCIYSETSILTDQLCDGTFDCPHEEDESYAFARCDQTSPYQPGNLLACDFETVRCSRLPDVGECPYGETAWCIRRDVPDHSGLTEGNHGYLGTSFHGYPESISLRLEVPRPYDSGLVCLSFWYRMTDESGLSPTQSLHLNHNHYTSAVWSRLGDHGDRWHHAHLTFQQVGQVTYHFVATSNRYRPADIQIDDLTHTPGQCSYQDDISCNFEVECSWKIEPQYIEARVEDFSPRMDGRVLSMTEPTLSLRSPFITLQGNYCFQMWMRSSSSTQDISADIAKVSSSGEKQWIPVPSWSLPMFVWKRFLINLGVISSPTEIIVSIWAPEIPQAGPVYIDHLVLLHGSDCQERVNSVSTACESGMFDCKIGPGEGAECLPLRYVGDGRLDCSNGCDEIDCEIQPPDSHSPNMFSAAAIPTLVIAGVMVVALVLIKVSLKYYGRRGCQLTQPCRLRRDSTDTLSSSGSTTTPPEVSAPPTYDQCVPDGISYTASSGCVGLSTTEELPPAYQRVIGGEFTEILSASAINLASGTDEQEGGGGGGRGGGGGGDEGASSTSTGLDNNTPDVIADCAANRPQVTTTETVNPTLPHSPLLRSETNQAFVVDGEASPRTQHNSSSQLRSEINQAFVVDEGHFDQNDRV